MEFSMLPKVTQPSTLPEVMEFSMLPKVTQPSTLPEVPEHSTLPAVMETSALPNVTDQIYIESSLLEVTIVFQGRIILMLHMLRERKWCCFSRNRLGRLWLIYCSAKFKKKLHFDATPAPAGENFAALARRCKTSFPSYGVFTLPTEIELPANISS
jgi:hypothetical protein